jgi:16S rRNA (cytidine1402-2'-O)-methyltransferase
VIQGEEPAAGVLYLVGTPIGNTGDLSPRARKVLEGANRIACEDTRRSGLLLAGLGIKSKLISFHQHNQLARIPQLLEALEAGETLAVISDAGLPGISDPGEALVAAARAAGRTVICIPGPCAVTTALVSSGLPSGRFCFEGFLPPKGQQRRARLRQLASEERTLVLFEAPHRLVDLLEDLLALSRLESGQPGLARERVEPGPLLESALEDFRTRPAAAGKAHRGRAGIAHPTIPQDHPAHRPAGDHCLGAGGACRRDEGKLEKPRAVIVDPVHCHTALIIEKRRHLSCQRLGREQQRHDRNKTGE